MFDAIYYFANECVDQLLHSPNYYMDLNGYSKEYKHTPLIACIHWNNCKAAEILLNDPRVDPNKPDDALYNNSLGWTPLHECVRFGRNEIAKLLIKHPKINIWIKSFENELPLDIGQYLGHDNKCQSLIDVVQIYQYQAIKQAVPGVPKVLCREIVEYIY